ncbi:MAG TPA: hypothetical protein VGD81_04785, partial [Opitutaceae bacterium]
LMTAREGLQKFPSNKYVARFTGAYAFDNAHPLKGLRLGTSVRWASAPIIGYYKTASSAYDGSRPYKGDEEFIVDPFISYKRRLTKDINWTIQLNIKNVFDEHGPKPTGAVNNIDGPDYEWIEFRNEAIDGRVFILTNTLSF